MLIIIIAAIILQKILCNACLTAQHMENLILITILT